ncbi:flagellar FliJ family protein [Georgenia subflava]|nr:flagellar FliJ family protein [Georgenia subflava]
MSRFRLAGLLRLRDLQEEQAAAELAERTRRRAAADARAQQAQRLLVGSEIVGGDAAAWRVSVATRAARSAAVADAQAGAAAATAEEVRAQGEWSTARQRSTTLEKLAEKHRTAVTEAENHSEQLTLDELAVQRATRQEER